MTRVPPNGPSVTGIVRDLADHGWSPAKIARMLSITTEQVRTLLAQGAPAPRDGAPEDDALQSDDASEDR